MSIFDTILTKLGINKPAAPVVSNAAAEVAAAKAEDPSAIKPGPTASIPMVDVVGKLNGMAKAHPGCDWKVSIADLLQLLGMDNSLNARKALATELGCPANLIGGDYSLMNQWLHKTVLEKLAANGGNIPPELLKK